MPKGVEHTDVSVSLANREHWPAGLGVLALAAVVAVVGARPYAGGWNDGSRLATVECLVDYRTLAIDASSFVRVPSRTESATPAPYPADEPSLLQQGTQDKLSIDGHFYSDKSPVPALLMAAFYKGVQLFFGLTACVQADWFCRLMTLATSGLAYVLAIWCIYRLGLPLDLPVRLRLTLAGSFALATMALPYSRHVNNHILLLAVAAVLLVQLAWLAHPLCTRVRFRLLAVGSLAGLGYTIDLAAGPLLLLATLGIVAHRRRRIRPVALVALAALPWLVLHHAVNYAVGGTWKPANAVAAYFQWPGCPFTSQNLTGSWHHRSMGDFLLYAGSLLAGKRGFFGHNLPLFLAIPGLVLLVHRHCRERTEVLFAAGWSLATWFTYALTSTNSSGLCCSIRWFVPLLSPGYYVLAVLLREHPASRSGFLILTVWGVILGCLMWWKGPWMKHMVPFFWPLQAGALVSWGLAWLWQRRQAIRSTSACVQVKILTPAA